MAEIEAALAEQNQQLIAESPDLSALLGTAPGQSLGGVLATNLSGPRRIAWGAMRDHVMGVRAVNGRGDVIRSGGRVLKNVTGLDLCKLLAGSHGTLGVLTEVTLKIHPRPESSGTLLMRGLDPEAGVAVLAAALGSPFGVSGAAFLPGWAAAEIPGFGDASLTLIRIEDFTASVAYRLGRLATDLEGRGLSDILDESESRRLWQAVRDVRPIRAAEGEAVWQVTTRPSRGPAILAAAQAAGARGFLDWGGGRLWLAGAGTVALHQTIMAAVGREGGSWTLMRAPEALRLSAAVVPVEVPALAALSQRVKLAMDPARILNPGRLSAAL
jgi:glycolate oxidase FAD binding subunit